MRKLYGILSISLFSMLTVFLASCGKGEDDLTKRDSFDVVMSVFFVILIAFVVGIIIFLIVKHYRDRR